MKISHVSLTLLISLLASYTFAQKDIEKEEMKPEETEVWTPVPAVVTPGNYHTAPSDAIVLFDGVDLSQWRKPQVPYEAGTIKDIAEIANKLDPDFDRKPAEWIVENGEIVVKPGAGPIESRMAFDDMQLHLEWMSPEVEGKTGQGYSNSGVFLMTFYEVQILNSFENKTYPNGQAGAVYKQHIPLVNASRRPGFWQSYDIIFTAPRFKDDGKLESPARVTVLHNGVLIQNNVELKGPSAYIGHPYYVKHAHKLPFRLQDHGDPIRFRNIWVREL